MKYGTRTIIVWHVEHIALNNQFQSFIEGTALKGNNCTLQVSTYGCFSLLWRATTPEVLLNRMVKLRKLRQVVTQ